MSSYMPDIYICPIQAPRWAAHLVSEEVQGLLWPSSFLLTLAEGHGLGLLGASKGAACSTGSTKSSLLLHV